jgi:glycosyltransferase involved in cell wall biosynthesis
VKTRLGRPSEESRELLRQELPEIDEPAGIGPPPAAAVSVVIPTLNEAENLRHVLPLIPSEYEVVVVDGHSDDGTVAVALELRPDAVVVQQGGRGKGNALLCGFLAAKGDIIVTLDADGSAAPDEIPLFVAALLAGADFAKGSRFLAGGGSTDLTWLRSAGNLFLGSVVNTLYGTRYSDLCYGYNAFWRRCLPFIPETAEGFEIETMMHIAIARAGLQVVEVASFEGARRYGESHLRTFRDGFRILGVIFHDRLTRERRERSERSRERVSVLDAA